MRYTSDALIQHKYLLYNYDKLFKNCTINGILVCFMQRVVLYKKYNAPDASNIEKYIKINFVLPCKNNIRNAKMHVGWPINDEVGGIVIWNILMWFHRSFEFNFLIHMKIRKNLLNTK